MIVQTSCHLEQTKKKYNAKLFFKKNWYNDLPLTLKRNIPKKRVLKTTMKNQFWKEFLKDPNVSELNSNLKSFKFNLNLT